MIPALRREEQADPHEFEVSLVYRANSRTTRATLRNPVSKSQRKKTEGRTICSRLRVGEDTDTHNGDSRNNEG